MAALEFLMSTDLQEAGLETLQEAFSCLKGGALRQDKDAESWLSWVLEACQGKDSSRPNAIHLLACSIPRCPRSILAGHIVKIAQILRSALSPTAPPACRRLGSLCVAALVTAIKTGAASSGRAADVSILGEAAGGGSGQQDLMEAVPKLVTSIIGCAAGDEGTDPGVKTAALLALADCVRVLGTLLKPQASKIEAAAYRCLVDHSEEVRLAAAECLASVPFSLRDGEVWTAMVIGLAAEAQASLQQVWPDVPPSSSSATSSSSSHRPLLPPLTPSSSGAHAYSAQCRRRLHGITVAITSLLSTGYPTPVTLPTPLLLSLCESLLHAPPKSTSPLAPTPMALPPSAIHALLPFLRQLAIQLSSSLLLALPGTACLRYLTRFHRIVLRLLSVPVTGGLRVDAYHLANRLVRVTGPASITGFVEPSLPLVTGDLTSLLFVERKGVISASLPRLPKGRKRGREEIVTNEASDSSGASAAAGGAAVADAEDDVARCSSGISLLRTVLASCGPALSPEGRRSVEELAARGLVELSRGLQSSQQQQHASRLASTPEVRQAFVGLVTTLAAVPCPGGTGTGLVPLIVRGVGALVLDADEGVAGEALLGRAVLDAILHPRACPLTIPRSLLEAEESEVHQPPPPPPPPPQHMARQVQQQQASSGKEGEAAIPAAAPSASKGAAPKQEKKKRQAEGQMHKGGTPSGAEKKAHAVLGGTSTATTTTTTTTSATAGGSSKQEAAVVVQVAKIKQQQASTAIAESASKEARVSSSDRQVAEVAKKRKHQAKAEEEEDEDELPDIVDEGPDEDDSD